MHPQVNHQFSQILMSKICAGAIIGKIRGEIIKLYRFYGAKSLALLVVSHARQKSDFLFWWRPLSCVTPLGRLPQAVPVTVIYIDYSLGLITNRIAQWSKDPRHLFFLSFQCISDSKFLEGSEFNETAH